MNAITALPLSADMIAWLAKEITNGKGNDMSRTAVVFNGKRPALYLNREIAGIVGKSFFPPKYFSVDELMAYTVEQNSTKTMLGDLEAAHRVYKICQNDAPALLHNRESFSQFLPWAKEILRFIDLCDKEGTSGDMLANTGRNAEIGLDVPDGINDILRHLSAVRAAFHKTLEERAEATSAYRYLLAARMAEETILAEFDTVIFAGFHYLHNSEFAVANALLRRGKARMVFFGSQDEWPLLAQNAEAFGAPIRPENETGAPPKLKLYAAKDTHEQAAIARQIIQQVANQERTLVAMPEGASLVPLLSEIAQVVERLNVSLGYPIRKSALYSLISAVIGAQTTRNIHGYYAIDYLKALAHPLIKTFTFGGDSGDIRSLTHAVESLLSGKTPSDIGESVFIKLSDIASQKELFGQTAPLERLHKLLFESFESVNTFADMCKALDSLLSACVECSTMEKYPLNIAAMNHMQKALEGLAAASFANDPMAALDMFRIFIDSIETSIAPFSGTPLGGLQVLGMLESRLLAFDTVIVMDANEETLPTIPINQPLIPREVMRMLGFNGLANEEEIQRHRFMRLISGAKEAHILYNDTDESEKSRFVQELIWRYEQAAAGAPKEQTLAMPLCALKAPAPIKKSHSVVHALHNMTWSASRLDAYLHCPKKFYFRYVLALNEQETVDDETDAREIGTFLHELLEQAYQPFVGKALAIDETFIKQTLSLLRSNFEKRLAPRMKSEAPMVLQTMLHRIEKFLRADGKHAPSVAQVISLEQQCAQPLVVKRRAYPFIAKIDRIERLRDGSLLVWDYKSGSIDKAPQSVERIAAALAQNTRLAIRDSIKSFQLPLYAYVVSAQYPQHGVDAKLYSLQDGRNCGLFKNKKDEGRHDEKLSLCMDTLGTVINEINDPAADFAPDESDGAQCANCPYRLMCR